MMMTTRGRSNPIVTMMVKVKRNPDKSNLLTQLGVGWNINTLPEFQFGSAMKCTTTSYQNFNFA
jgi:hypothetical protein